MKSKVCPYCEREMELGYFKNFTNPVQWIPYHKKPPLFRSQVVKGAVSAGIGNFFIGYKATAYYCRNCRVVIVPVE